MRVALIGVGMIGGSLLAAWRDAGQVTAAAGYDVDAQAVAIAADRGLIDRRASSIADALRDAEFVLIATPVGAMGDVLGQLAPALPVGAIVASPTSAAPRPASSRRRATRSALPSAASFRRIRSRARNGRASCMPMAACSPASA